LAEASKALHYPSGESTPNLLNPIVISGYIIKLTAPHKADLHSPLRIDWHAQFNATSVDEHAVSTMNDGPRRL
jgi:hypothetical protein